MTITSGRVVKLRRWVFAIACVGLLIGAATASAEAPEGDLSPDVVVFELPSTLNWGDDGALTAYSVGTTSCNRGDAPLDWISSTNEHPVIAQNLYRVTLPDDGSPPEHGSIEMLGMSWLKHGFVSINSATPGCGDCPGNPPGSQLGVGCTDPYSAGLNGSQSRLGPRSEVNAYTGYFEANYAVPSGSSTLAGRLQVRTSEIVEDPATFRYFVEGHYVSPDDAAAGNGGNNASFREVVVDGTDLDTTGPTEEGRPGIYAWRDLDPAVTIREVVVPGEGIFIVGFKVGDNGDGTWRYEYAVFNLNSHLSGGSFAVPIYSDSQITDIGFRDVDYHSGEPYDDTDWTPEVDLAGGMMRWSTEDFAANPNANALRWSTMYNFRFDADSPPQETVGQIGLFRDGGPASVPVILLAPAADTTTIFIDGFDLGDTSGWDVVVP